MLLDFSIYNLLCFKIYSTILYIKKTNNILLEKGVTINYNLKAINFKQFSLLFTVSILCKNHLK